MVLAFTNLPRMNLNCAVGRQSTDNVVLQAMDQADTRSASLIAENTTLKTRHDEFKRLTEDLQLKLGDAMSAKEILRHLYCNYTVFSKQTKVEIGMSKQL